jgi:hypothetical protein
VEVKFNEINKYILKMRHYEIVHPLPKNTLLCCLMKSDEISDVQKAKAKTWNFGLETWQHLFTPVQRVRLRGQKIFEKQ